MPTKIRVPIKLIREAEKSPTLRIGQSIINAYPKPASLMLNDELEKRRALFYMSNEDFWKRHAEFVEIDYQDS